MEFSTLVDLLLLTRLGMYRSMAEKDLDPDRCWTRWQSLGLPLRQLENAGEVITGSTFRLGGPRHRTIGRRTSERMYIGGL